MSRPFDPDKFPCGHPRVPENMGHARECRTCRRRRARVTRRALTAARTRCYRGHEYTPESSYVDAGGRRRCRLCEGITDRRRDPQFREPVLTDLKRFRRWLVSWLAEGTMSGREVYEAAQLHSKMFYGVCTGARKTLPVSALDAILCAVGEPGLLPCFYSASGGRLAPLPKRHARRRFKRSSRCSSGDRCPRQAGHGPNGWFCEHHGAELERIAAELYPRSKAARDQRRRAFVKGREVVAR